MDENAFKSQPENFSCLLSHWFAEPFWPDIDIESLELLAD